MSLIQAGNSKLGHVPCFSIVAGDACPGKTAACAKHCYAMKGFFRMSNVAKKHRANWAASKRTTFVARMIKEIQQAELKLLRIHVAGDFYDAPYVRKWIKIVKACPDTRFYAYTRSWRTPKLVPALKELAKLPNFYMWWSADKDSHAENGRPPRVKSSHVAYMQCEGDEAVPSYVDLIFRLKTNREPAKYVDGHIICPVEQGRENDITCEKCRICFRDEAVPSKRDLVQLA